jgi:hypothetical protein
MFNDFPFLHFSEVKRFFGKDHGRSGEGLSEGNRGERNAKQNSE